MHKSSVEIYHLRKEKYSTESKKLNEEYNRYSFLRLVLALGLLYFIYKALSSAEGLFAGLAILFAAGFVIAVKKHREIMRKKKLKENLIRINSQEAKYLEQSEKPGYNGERYIDPTHFYSFDLDIFGKESLFHHLNRTTTHIGQTKLAKSLINRFTNTEIVENQIAINELSGKLDWRQDLAAEGRTMDDQESNYEKLIEWSVGKHNQISKEAVALSFILPVLFLTGLGLTIAGILTVKWVVLLFVINLLFTGTQLAKIKQEVIDSKNVAETIRYYGEMLGVIEKETFNSGKLKRLQSELAIEQVLASEEIKKLSAAFLKLQGINFQLGAIVLNGTMAYHTHALRSLLKWKENHAPSLQRWLEIIGEFEVLSSMGNFAYNNPDFFYPVLNSDLEVSFDELGHPLIAESVRVSNSIQLNQSNFVILTGSNMSGKSTFLRTLGINMILGGVGSPVCARYASIHPLPILVSMRQSDSLSSGESYFFAEVKRLKSIMNRLEEETCFVLLDEILRGTNSDDKQSGTIGVIRKIISKSAIGGIATHDLEVCRLTDDFPDKLENKNFEVQIINDELVFDYKLREGVCQNKSATFLMKKMEII